MGPRKQSSWFSQDGGISVYFRFANSTFNINLVVDSPISANYFSTAHSATPQWCSASPRMGS